MFCDFVLITQRVAVLQNEEVVAYRVSDTVYLDVNMKLLFDLKQVDVVGFGVGENGGGQWFVAMMAYEHV